jgi:Alpha/beta hydrolase family
LKTRIAIYVAFILLASTALMVGVQPAVAVAPRDNVIEGLFDVGGYRLYLRCTGNGSPTVVMDAGGSDDSSIWSKVEPSLAPVTRVCVYDRAGLGLSDSAPIPRTSQTMVDDLNALLRVADVPGPYVVVGHSIAGWNVRLFASEDGGDTVVGVVLVDGTPPEFIALLDSIGFPIPPPEDTENNPDGLDFRASAAQVLAAGPFPPVPLIVLTHGSPGYGPPLEEPWQALQVAQSQLSPEGRLIVARTPGHYIHVDQPRLVFRAIVQVVAWSRHDAARGHAVSAAG